MTDNEIIEALECCQTEDCESCPLFNYDGCKSLLFDGNIVLDLINRQKAEIERLQKNNKEYGFCNLLGNCLVYSKNLKDYNDMRKGLKAEVIKEFAERLKKKTYPFPCAIGVENAVTIRAINDLVKEMVGDAE